MSKTFDVVFSYDITSVPSKSFSTSAPSPSILRIFSPRYSPLQESQVQTFHRPDFIVQAFLGAGTPLSDEQKLDDERETLFQKFPKNFFFFRLG